MAVRIREDGRILCAAMHSAESGDTYIDDGLHYRLSADLGVLVTEPMHCDGGRGGHAYHGQWWWRDRMPADIELAPYYLRKRGLAQFLAFRAKRKAAIAGATHKRIKTTSRLFREVSS